MKMLNLTGYIEDLAMEMKAVLEPVGWILKDGTGYYEFGPKSKPNNHGDMTMPDSWMVLYPELLEYSEGSKDVHTVWFKTGDRDISDKAMNALLEAMTPFKDEDYTGRNLWFNPLYPDGYWNNHALND
jgi:hypothetical protein